jgi:hypothetical protein
MLAAAFLQDLEVLENRIDPLSHTLHAALDVAANRQVLLERQVLEQAAAFERVGDPAPDDVVRRQPIQPLANKLDRTFVTWPPRAADPRSPSASWSCRRRWHREAR